MFTIQNNLLKKERENNMLKKFNDRDYEKVASVPTEWGARYNLYQKDGKFYMQISDSGLEVVRCSSDNTKGAITELKNYINDIYYETRK